MAKVEIRRNEIPDPVLARLFEHELAEAAEAAGTEADPLACTVLDEGLHAEIEVDLPGWTETVRIRYPVRAGDVRRAFLRVLREVGLADSPALHLTAPPRL